MKWIKHTGNEMPVSGDTLVLIKLRYGGTTSDFSEASDYVWQVDDSGTDIMEYALDESQDQKDQEPQKTLRDEFAMAALTGLLNAYAHRYDHEDSVKEAYLIADMMMKARSK